MRQASPGRPGLIFCGGEKQLQKGSGGFINKQIGMALI
jgi:hypothetical protein